jgi:hypothetical protein
MLHLPRLVAGLLALGVLKHIVPLERLARRAWREPRQAGAARTRAEIIGRVLQAGRWSGLPDRDCVQRSLLLFRELSAHGFEPVLVVGLRRRDDRVTGHAWVEIDGTPVSETSDALAAFTVAARFGRHGSLIADADTGVVKASA